MTWNRIERSRWPSFFDSASRALKGTQAEVEVIGLELGDQFEEEWLPLSGLTYEPREDVLYVYLERNREDVGHAISHPEEVWTQLDEEGLAAIACIDREGHKQFVRFRRALALPAAQPSP